MIKVYQLKALQNNYIVSIPFKGAKVRCEFKNGNIAKGIYARLVTNEPFRQKAIEQSDMYGKMWQLTETIKEPGDDEVKKPAPKPVATKPATKKDAEPTPEPVPEAAEPTPAEPADDGKGKMEFANLAEAVVYIATTYGQQVENASQARKVFADNGIKAVIHNG